LQLIDPSQDPVAVVIGANGTGWRFFSITGNIGISTSQAGTNLLIFVNLAGEAYLDDISLVPLSGPLAGSNVLVNGDFETLLCATVGSSQYHDQFRCEHDLRPFGQL